nr:hypothetical protein CFP56_31825 [Quercus suber]
MKNVLSCSSCSDQDERKMYTCPSSNEVPYVPVPVTKVPSTIGSAAMPKQKIGCTMGSTQKHDGGNGSKKQMARQRPRVARKLILTTSNIARQR